MGKTVVAFSDLHADSAPAEVQAAHIKFLKSLVNRQDVACVVSVGDLWSMTLDSSIDTVISNSHCGKVRDLLRQLSGTKTVALVDGNHDPYSELSKPDRARFMAWLAAPDITFPGKFFNKRYSGLPTYYCTHGCQFDPTHDMWKVITEALRAVLGPKAAEKLFKWVVGIYLKQKSGPTPSQVREHDPDAYAQMVSLMHEEMWKWTLDKKNGYELIVMGHTHFDELRHKALCNKTYVNCGAFDGFGNTCVEVTGEGPELLKW